jgi:hypothetical protein
VTEPTFIDIECNTPTTFYVYRYPDGSVQIRKPRDNEPARQHGIHTINLTEKEGHQLAAILKRKARPVEVKVIDMRHPELYIGDAS